MFYHRCLCYIFNQTTMAEEQEFIQRHHVTVFFFVYFNFLQQAMVRGVSTTVVGLVFGTYPFMSFISAPICGRLVSTLSLNY